MDLITALQIPTSQLDLFLRTVEISAYLPGRIRLYSKQMIGNAALEGEVKAQLEAFPEISEVTTNTVTGSILILYEPEKLRRNAELRKAEQYIMTHAKKGRVVPAR